MTPSQISAVIDDCLRDARGGEVAVPGSPVSWARAREAQLAHARVCMLVRQAGEHGVERAVARPEVLADPRELALVALLADAGPVAQRARARGTTRPLTRHLDLTAQAFEAWFAATRVTPRAGGPVTDVHRNRLWLALATRAVLARCLHRLGLGAPERM